MCTAGDRLGLERLKHNGAHLDDVSAVLMAGQVVLGDSAVQGVLFAEAAAVGTTAAAGQELRSGRPRLRRTLEVVGDLARGGFEAGGG